MPRLSTWKKRMFGLSDGIAYSGFMAIVTMDRCGDGNDEGAPAAADGIGPLGRGRPAGGAGRTPCHRQGHQDAASREKRITTVDALRQGQHTNESALLCSRR